MAPSKTSVQPESLGFGFAKMVHSSFMNTVFMFLPKLVECINNDSIGSFAQNGFVKPIDTDVIKDYIKSLTNNQVQEFAAQLSGHVFKATMGSGSTAVCPSGWIMCEMTMLGTCVGTRVVYQTADTQAISTYNALRPKPSAVVMYPTRLIGVECKQSRITVVANQTFQIRSRMQTKTIAWCVKRLVEEAAKSAAERLPLEAAAAE